MNTPTQAVLKLHGQGATEAAIAEAVGVNQTTINRIKKGAEPSYSLGVKLMALRFEDLKKPVATA